MRMFLFTFHVLKTIFSYKDITNRFSNVDSSYQAFFGIGKLGEFEFFQINLKNGFSYLSKRYLPDVYGYEEDNQSEIFVEIDKKGNMSGKIVKTELYLQDNNLLLENFHFLYFREMQALNSISFAHKFIDERFNLIEHLYRNKSIEKKQVSFYVDSSFSGQLLFGNIPQRILQLFPVHGSCLVHQDFPYWGCDIKSIKVLDVVYDNTKKIASYFGSSEKRLNVPSEFFKVYNDSILNGYYLNGTCNYMGNENRTTVRCICDKTVTFPSFTIIFGGDLKISLKNEELFQNYIYNCYLLIGINFQKDEWDFGLPVFRNFIVGLDYENDKMIFYSNDTESINYDIMSGNLKSNRSISKYVLIFLINILSIFSVGCWVIFKQVKTNE